MPHFSRVGELHYDHEIENIVCRLRKEAKQRRNQSASLPTPRVKSAAEIVEPSNHLEEEVMANNEGRTLRELAAPGLHQQPLCIEYADLAVPFELKSGLIHLLPTFCGLSGEDPHKHLTEFHVVCLSMKPQGITEEQIKLRAFPFSLDDKAKDWLYYLPSSSITTWNDVKRQFLGKFFPASRTANIKKEICGIRQFSGETLYEYWERFKQLCASCPEHQIPDQLLIQYFYEGLLSMDRSMIDAASGGVLVDKTLTQAGELISNMAANSQQFSYRFYPPANHANKVNISPLEQQIASLTSLVRQMIVGNIEMVKACGICSTTGHPTNMCPTLQDEPYEQANTVGGFSQKRYVPYSNTYSAGWRDHPNLSYGAKPFDFQQQYQSRPPAPQYSSSNPGMSLDEIVKELATNTQQFQQETRTNIQNLENQVSQLATAMSRMESQVSGRLPSQTMVNPKQNVSAITLRSGNELNRPSKEVLKNTTEEEIEKEALPPQTQDPGGKKP
ncbi:PREDICTED: uncharacterized protein LOC104588150 [Nelumbo nucifera]|uniref:Uncharacterized protein LOC104588150 n=1 Tax=Nelumbo nucifera TaxID=4432 RepID=A0A1U7ZAQ0_NELNU|nr:PREDICTED: uncharacterized protein LOC104588150 [Nelumbo nucifera]